MDASEYKFSDDEIIQLNEYRDLQSDARLKVRFIALLMMAEEVEPHNTKGIASLNSFQYKPKQSFLSLEQTEEIVGWVKKNNPGKIKEVQQFIKDQFKIQYSHEAVRKILKKNGLKFLKPKVVPGNPPTETEQKNCRTILQIESREPRGHCFLIWRWDAFNPSKRPWILLGRPEKCPHIKNKYRASASEYFRRL